MRRDKTDKSVVLPEPDAPMIPQSPPLMQPETFFKIDFGSKTLKPLRAFVVTQTSLKVSTAGA